MGAELPGPAARKPRWHPRNPTTLGCGEREKDSERNAEEMFGLFF